MPDVDQPFTQVLTWRVEQFRIRIIQVAVVGLMSTLAIGPTAAAIWAAATAATALLDWRACKILLAKPTSRRALGLVCVSLPLSAVAFATIVIPLLERPARGAVAEAALVLCAITLNNAIMTRASRLGTSLLLGPQALVLLVMPLIAHIVGHHLNLEDLILLELGAGAYLAFIGRLAATLHAEGLTVIHALADQDAQRRRAEFAMEEAVQSRARWRMLFDQSPLPQSCFNASSLHAALRAHIESGGERLGDRLEAMMAGDSAAILKLIALVDANEAAEALFGVDQFSQIVSSTRLHASFFTGFCAGLNAMNEDGVLAPFEAKIVRANGAMVDVRVHVRMPPGQEPAWGACMISYVDMTEAHRAAKAQQAAVQAAEAANHAKSEFLAVVSHEIRTPLNGVLGMAQAMELEPLEPAQKHRLSIIRQSGAALLEILNDVLDLSKIEAGKLELETADFDLGAVVRAAQASFSEVAQRKGLSLTVAIEPTVQGCYRGDAVRVRQIVYNLVANAVKFTESGGVKITVAGNEGGVRIAVSDTGIGIASDRVAKLFGRFVQADSSTTRKFGGTGLGLAICRELCTAMGGDITVTSELGVGSTFAAGLPLAVGVPADTVVGALSHALEPSGHGAPDTPMRVLAAEDNEVNQLVLKTLLAQIGIEPRMVANGAEAVAAFTQGPWDLVLMDVQMPVMDGLTATRAIRELELRGGMAPTPIVALTANAMSHQIESYRAAGMTRVLAKPIEVAKLYETLAEAAPEARPAERGAA
jgi:CheY-like chemotaxis protein